MNFTPHAIPNTRSLELVSSSREKSILASATQKGSQDLWFSPGGKSLMQKGKQCMVSFIYNSVIDKPNRQFFFLIRILIDCGGEVEEE